METHERFRLQFDAVYQRLRMVPSGPTTIQVRTHVDRANELLRGLPRVIPTMSEILNAAMRSEMSEHDLATLVELFYGHDRVMFNSTQGAGQHAARQMDIRSHWRDRQWNSKTDDITGYLSVEGLAHEQWVASRQVVERDQLDLFSDVTNVGTQRLELLTTRAPYPIALIPEKGPAGILGFEAILRAFETVHGMDVRADPEQYRCEFQGSICWVSAYRIRRGLGSKRLVFVTLGVPKPPTPLEALYRQSPLEGFSFDQFVQLRSDSGEIAA